MSLFLTKECGLTTVQEERGTDDRGSLAILTAMLRASSRVSSLAAERRARRGGGRSAARFHYCLDFRFFVLPLKATCSSWRMTFAA